MAKPKIEKEQPPWQAIPAEVYRQEAGKLVHFSAKAVNSNADAFGVRLNQQSRLPMPYVAARCLLDKAVGLALDYSQNPGGNKTEADSSIKVADVIKQIRRLQTAESEAVIAEGDNFASLKSLLDAVFAEAYADPEGLQSVSPRMRQLLLPKADDYVSITPLPCGGLSQEINRRIQAHNEAAKNNNLNKINSATLGVGGSNPQNVGSLVREMQTAWAFNAPTEDRSIRAALAMHHNGIAVNLPRKPMQAWKDWRSEAAAKNNGQIPSDMRSRDQEQKQVLDVAKGVLHQGRKALCLLEQHQVLLGETLLADSLQDSVIRGLIDPGERSKEWPRNFGERVAQAIGSYKIGQNDQQLFLPLEGQSLHQVARWIEEFVR
jgi:hypothetical protein